jgi:8-oxo-dGTP diphosphatase
LHPQKSHSHSHGKSVAAFSKTMKASSLCNVKFILFVYSVIITIAYLRSSFSSSTGSLTAIYPHAFKCPYKWHGGSPTHNGSCWCGFDDYCMCTPSLAIDAIIEVQHTNKVQIVLVRRKEVPKDKHAIIGGFVDIGETVESAVIREVKEETNLDVTSVELFQVYSDPSRDLRRHTVSVVYRCRVDSTTSMRKGDDAKAVELIDISEATKLDLAFDHAIILKDFINKYHLK